MFTDEYLTLMMNLLEPLKGLEQDKRWHPEKDVYTHSVQCYLRAMRETDSIDEILAALLHDVGKAVNKLGHDKESVILLHGITSVKSLWLIANHMRINHYMDGSMVKAAKARELQSHPWFTSLVALNRWDKMARKPEYEPTLTIDQLNADLSMKARLHFRAKPVKEE